MVPYLRAANIKDGELDLSDVKSMNFTPTEQTIFSLRSGDVLITEGSGSIGSVGASAVWHGEIEGAVCFQNTLLRMRPRAETAEGRFLGWWARSAFGSGLFSSIASGANIYHLSAERIRALRVDLPSLEEQRRIADFLDAETNTLAQFENGIYRQLALLEERELAHVFDAVRGAGIGERHSYDNLSWLGDVPETWLVASVSSQFSIQLGKMLNQEQVNGDRLRPYLRVANVQWDKVHVDDLAYMDFSEEERPRYEVLPGDLLICEGGSYPGRAAIWDGRIGEIYYQKALHRARSRGRSLVRWLYYCLRIARTMGIFEADGNTSTITHLTGEQISARRFPFPDPKTQEEIVRYLDREIVEECRLVSAVRRQLSLLAERRQALITAAVTGQIDVTTARGADLS
ncbi:type I restriction-modification system specificity subunit [Spinactinospora alkalitolerans]